jgi:hypothetical protein
MDDQLYYTGTDKLNERFNRQGTGYLIQVTEPIDFNGSPIVDDLVAGSVYIDWECEFQIPQINPEVLVPSAPTATVLNLQGGDTVELPESAFFGVTTMQVTDLLTTGNVELDGPVTVSVSHTALGLFTASSVNLPAGSYSVALTNISGLSVAFYSTGTPFIVVTSVAQQLVRALAKGGDEADQLTELFSQLRSQHKDAKAEQGRSRRRPDLNVNHLESPDRVFHSRT